MGLAILFPFGRPKYRKDKFVSARTPCMRNVRMLWHCPQCPAALGTIKPSRPNLPPTTPRSSLAALANPHRLPCASRPPSPSLWLPSCPPSVGSRSPPAAAGSWSQSSLGPAHPLRLSVPTATNATRCHEVLPQHSAPYHRRRTTCKGTSTQRSSATVLSGHRGCCATPTSL